VVVPFATCTRTFDLMTRPAGMVLPGVLAIVVVVVDGVALDGDAARTMKNVAPTNNTTMMKTTLSEGW